MHFKGKDSGMITYMKISVFIPTKLNFIQCTKRYIFVAYETYTLTGFRTVNNYVNACLFLGRQPTVGQGLLIHEVSKFTQPDAPQSVGLLWTSDQPIAETSTWQHTNIHAPGGIRIHNISRQAASDLRLRSRGHWDRRSYYRLPILNWMAFTSW